MNKFKTYRIEPNDIAWLVMSYFFWIHYHNMDIYLITGENTKCNYVNEGAKGC